MKSKPKRKIFCRSGLIYLLISLFHLGGVGMNQESCSELNTMSWTLGKNLQPLDHVSNTLTSALLCPRMKKKIGGVTKNKINIFG